MSSIKVIPMGTASLGGVRVLVGRQGPGFLVTLDAPGRNANGRRRHVGVIRPSLRAAVNSAVGRAGTAGIPVAFAACASVVAHATALDQGALIA